MRRRRQIVGLVLLGLASGAIFVLWPKGQPPAQAERPWLPAAPAIAETQVLNPGFLGATACAECHADRVAEFQATNHFHTFRPATPETMPLTGFDPARSEFTTPNPQLSFSMTREGNTFFESAKRTSASGTETTRSTIDRIIGAGTADDVYVSWHTDGRMYELPIAWLHTSQQWGAANFDPYGSGDFARELNPRCLECHNTWIHHVPGTPNQYLREGALFGVTCERCHGPGSEHVAWHREHPDAAAGEHIVRPAALQRESQIAVCTQCHSNAMKLRGPAFTHRADDPLEKSFKMLQPPHNEEDHVANQIQYLRQSRCFQDSDMTCTTCHDPHRGRESGRLAAAQAACFKCHAAAECGEQPRLPESVRDNCTGCHLPAYVKMNVTFATADDAHLPPMFRYEHRIAVYPAARDQVLLDWFRTQSEPDAEREAGVLAERLVAHWTRQAAACQQAHRVLGAIGAWREALRARDTPDLRAKLQEAVGVQVQLDRDYARALHAIENRRFDEAIATLEAILRIKPNLAKAHGRLGTAYVARGDRQRGIRHLEAVIRYDPDDSYGEAMLGWLSYLDGDGPRAIEHLTRASDIEPHNAKIEMHRALALLLDGQLDEGLAGLQKTLEIDPRQAEAAYRLAVTCCERGLPEQAIAWAQHAVRLTDQGNLDALLALVRAYVDDGRFDQAAGAVAAARQLADNQAPPRKAEVEAWASRIAARRKRSRVP